MNTARVWILRLAAIAVLIFSGFLLVDAYQGLTWYNTGMDADFGPLRSDGTRAHDVPLDVRYKIREEATIRERDGRSARNAGVLLICAALLMEGLASALKKLENRSLP